MNLLQVLQFRTKKIDWLFPHYVTEEGFIKLAFQVFLVEAPGLRLVVDTCIGNDKPRHMLGGNSLQTSFLENLSTAGWSRESVDLVVCTHLHVDHVGWNTMKDGDAWVPTFPNARYLFGATNAFDPVVALKDIPELSALAPVFKPRS